MPSPPNEVSEATFMEFWTKFYPEIDMAGVLNFEGDQKTVEFQREKEELQFKVVSQTNKGLTGSKA